MKKHDISHIARTEIKINLPCAQRWVGDLSSHRALLAAHQRSFAEEAAVGDGVHEFAVGIRDEHL